MWRGALQGAVTKFLKRTTQNPGHVVELLQSIRCAEHNWPMSGLHHFFTSGETLRFYSDLLAAELRKIVSSGSQGVHVMAWSQGVDGLRL